MKLLKLMHYASYQYYKQIAQHLQIQIPPINQQILYPPHAICKIHGIKLAAPPTTNNIDPFQLSSPTQPTTQPTTTQPTTTQPTTQPTQPTQPTTLPTTKYIYCQQSSEVLQFKQALEAAHSLEMDLCLLQKQPIVLHLTHCKKQIYQKYQQKLTKHKKLSKTINISTSIQLNDINTKVNRTLQHLKQGIRKFIIKGDSDSQQCRLNIKKFSSLLGKNDYEPTLVTIKKQIKARRKKYIMEEKWELELFFEDQIPINQQYLDKKWRRFNMNFQPKHTYSSNYEDTPFQLQKQAAKAFIDLDIGLPDGLKHFQTTQEQINEQIEKFLLQNDDDIDLKKDFQNVIKNSSKDNKINKNRESMTVQEIVDQIASMRKDKKQLSSFEIYKLQSLEKKLKLLLKIDNTSKHQL